MRRCNAAILSIFLMLNCDERVLAVDQILYAKVPQVSVLAISKDIEFDDLVPQRMGSNISIVEDATSYFDISNNIASSTKIVARLNNPPKGLTVFALLTPPPGAIGGILTKLSSADQVLVSGLGRGCFSQNKIYYKAIADLEALPALANFNTLITYTLVNGGS